MAQLRQMALLTPRKAAAILAETGETLDYATLDARSARLAAWLVDQGRVAGDGIALLSGNSLRHFELCWGARRAGLYFTPISTQLQPHEVGTILHDAQPRVVFVSSAFLPLLEQVVQRDVRVVVVDAGEDYTGIVDARGPLPPLPRGPQGRDMVYSSGTTGRPKGIRHPLAAQGGSALSGDWLSFFGLDASSVYLSPAPLYHAAPLRFTLRCIELGATVIVLQRFDAERCLSAIARYRVTHAQWVPTMFVRLLALPREVRDRHDTSSLRQVVHAAAPCPEQVKLRMIEWWGPIVWEYYGGSERNGTTLISSAEWLARRGSVGRAALGQVHIVDEAGNECPPGMPGAVYFSGGPPFEYHNDPDKTVAGRNAQGWSTIGDIGYLDADGYLYLTDRQANMIISGGVNIYPQETENCLLAHPLVADVAVVGVPHAEFGEEVRAVVQLQDPALASAALGEELIAFCRQQLSHLKCPRRVDFDAALPRSETGKLLKRLVRDRYWNAPK